VKTVKFYPVCKLFANEKGSKTLKCVEAFISRGSPLLGSNPAERPTKVRWTFVSEERDGALAWEEVKKQSGGLFLRRGQMARWLETKRQKRSGGPLAVRSEMVRWLGKKLKTVRWTVLAKGPDGALARDQLTIKRPVKNRPV